MSQYFSLPEILRLSYLVAGVTHQGKAEKLTPGEVLCD